MDMHMYMQIHAYMYIYIYMYVYVFPLAGFAKHQRPVKLKQKPRQPKSRQIPNCLTYAKRNISADLRQDPARRRTGLQTCSPDWFHALRMRNLAGLSPLLRTSLVQ